MIHFRYDYANVINLTWHPTGNIVSFTTSDGELYIYANFVPTEHIPILEKTLQPAPYIHDPLAETSGNARNPSTNGFKNLEVGGRLRRGTPDSLDDILGSDIMGNDEDDFVSDDDGAGYADGMNEYGKRTNGHLDALNTLDVKRRAQGYGGKPQLHQSFQPGSTPWRGNRKYLCECQLNNDLGTKAYGSIIGLNLTGFVWTVDQETHHTVTAEFYDREFHRDFHFTDPYLYDKACLSKHLHTQ